MIPLWANVLLGIGGMFVCGVTAQTKNRPRLGWMIFGALLPVIAVICVAVASSKHPCDEIA